MSAQEEDTQLSAIDSLYRISSLVNTTDEPKAALNIILRELVSSLKATSASIVLINPDTNQLEMEAYYGLPHDTEKTSLSIGEGITGWVALHGKPLLIHDVHQEPRYVSVKDSIRSELAVPMQTEGAQVGQINAQEKFTVGVINVDSEVVGAFDEQDLKLLTLLTNEATRVISRLWLIDQLKAKAHQLESLIDIGHQLVRKLELEEVLDAVTQKARALMQCRFCAIFLYEPSTQKLKLASLAGENGKISYEETLNLEDSALGVAIQRKKQIDILDIPFTEEHHFINLTQNEGLASLLATPIIYEDQAIGILNAYTTETHRFNNDEKKTLSLLATLGAVATQNAQLYSRIFSSEESLRKNERLTTLGLLAAEIAHEIRNPLTVIKLLFDSLGLDYEAGDARQHDAKLIVEKIKHLEQIVTNVLSFGKSNIELHSRCLLNNLIEETLLMLRLKLKQSRIELVYNPPRNSIYIDVHKAQIQQVLLNLMLNAEQAMPQGGVITISIQAEKGCASIQVTDTGSGVPEEIKNNIFEGFLTSKHDGTGLGLSISKRIMKQHRGDIQLLETSPKGATFEFTLPTL